MTTKPINGAVRPVWDLTYRDLLCPDDEFITPSWIPAEMALVWHDTSSARGGVRRRWREQEIAEDIAFYSHGLSEVLKPTPEQLLYIESGHCKYYNKDLEFDPLQVTPIFDAVLLVKTGHGHGDSEWEGASLRSGLINEFDLLDFIDELASQRPRVLKAVEEG